MKGFALLASAISAVSAAALGPRDPAVTATVLKTVTVPCATSLALTSPSGAPASGSAVLGPVRNPTTDPSNLNNIVPKSNFTMFYGSNDTSTPDTNAQVSLQMKMTSVLLEDISSVETVVCSDDGLSVTFNDTAGYEMSLKEWPSSGQFVLFTNHLGNCDAEFERGLFLVDGLTFDEATLTVTANAEKSDLQSCAGGMQIDFGQLLASTPSNSTEGVYSNSTGVSKRDIKYDPTYSLSFNKALAANTVIAQAGSSLEVVANTASFTSGAQFSGHLDYNFWAFKLKQLYFDFDVEFDVNLNLTTTVNAAYSNSFAYAPASLTISPINIPGVLSLGPALNVAIGVQLSANAKIVANTATEVKLADGNVHVDLVTHSNTKTSGWQPTYSASASINSNATIDINPYVELGVELEVDFLGGLVDLSSGLTANATLTNELTLITSAGAKSSSGSGSSTTAPTGSVNGVCVNGLGYQSEFLFDIVGFITKAYSATLYSVELPLFDKCLAF